MSSDKKKVDNSRMDLVNKAKYIGDIKDHKIMMGKSIIPNTIFPSKFLTTEESLKNADLPPSHATKISYQDFYNFVELHSSELFDDSKEYMIKILCEHGWRNSSKFRGQNFYFYDPLMLVYQGDEDDVRYIFAVQIIEVQ